jgi:hypothetical protein
MSDAEYPFVWRNLKGWPRLRQNPYSRAGRRVVKKAAHFGKTSCRNCGIFPYNN